MLNYQRVDWKDAVRTHPLKLRMHFQNPPLTTLCSPGFSSNHFAFCHALQSTSSCSLLSTSAHSGYRSRYRTASGILPQVFCARGILVLIHHLFLAVFPGLQTEYRHVKRTCTIPSCPSSYVRTWAHLCRCVRACEPEREREWVGYTAGVRSFALP